MGLFFAARSPPSSVVFSPASDFSLSGAFGALGFLKSCQLFATARPGLFPACGVSASILYLPAEIAGRASWFFLTRGGRAPIIRIVGNFPRSFPMVYSGSGPLSRGAVSGRPFSLADPGQLFDGLFGPLEWP